MPKTRRAGRKNQLRRLTARLYYSTPSSAYSDFVGIDYRDDSEYDNLFNAPAPFKVDNNSDVKLREWPSQLSLIEFKKSNILNYDIPSGDPRRTRYLQDKTDIPHAQVHQGIPEHEPNVVHPLEIQQGKPLRKL